MFREMRRMKNSMSETDTLNLLKRGQEGILGTIGENNYPYTVVLNYVFMDDKIYFHSAKTGHKLDNILYNKNVSFTVYDSVKIVEEEFTTKYKSVTLFGHAKVVESNKEILMKLIEKYSPNFYKEGVTYVGKDFTTTVLIEVEIKHITGKERV
mgnify:CR=1 FL=1